MTRLSRQQYYVPRVPVRTHLEQSVKLGYEVFIDEATLEPDSDVYAICIEQVVSVTPLSLDLTSRVAFNTVEDALRAAPGYVTDLPLQVSRTPVKLAFEFTNWAGSAGLEACSILR